MELDIIDKTSKVKSPALSLCHKDQGGPANKRPVSLLMKTDGVEITEDIQKALDKFKDQVSTEEVVQEENATSEVEKASGEKPEQQEENEASRLDNVIEKTEEENMTQEATNVDKIEIDKAQLDELQKSLKALEELQKAAEQKDEVIKSLQADKEARDLQEVTKACEKFVAVSEKEELAKAIFAIQKAGMSAEAATIFKSFADIQKAADEALEAEAGKESTDEVSVEEVTEADLLKAAIAEMKGE